MRSPLPSKRMPSTYAGLAFARVDRLFEKLMPRDIKNKQNQPIN